MGNNRDLEVLLADLRRQRKDVEDRLATTSGRKSAAADIVERLRKLRERAERTNNDDTLRKRS